MEKLILKEENAVDWVYRGEGAANLVLAYTGSSTEFIGKVMRIQKSQRKGKSRVKKDETLTPYERLLWRKYVDLILWPNKDIVQQMYVKHVMSPLLGPKHVDAGMHASVTKEFLQSVAENVTCRRPAARIDSSQIDLDRDSVLILSDHSVFMNGTLKGEPCLTVEIKPKCGFLPESRYIAEENAVKRTIPRFKLHQELKLHNQEISEYSEYNPLDLFSGSLDRISKAIEALYATPQNNFRVFLNGSIVFGGLGGGIGSTTVLDGEAFEDELKHVIEADHGLCKTSFIQLIAQTIHTSGVLDKLLEVQKLDVYDIEGAIHAYYNIFGQPCMVCAELSEEKSSNDYTSLHSIPLEESLKIVREFLIAATVKDCSMMISFKPLEDVLSENSYNTVYLGSTKQVFEYKVFFIDLDLKPVKKMEEYYKLDKKIVNCYCHKENTEHKADKAAC